MDGKGRYVLTNTGSPKYRHARFQQLSECIVELPQGVTGH
jgi:hypothetical protein